MNKFKGITTMRNIYCECVIGRGGSKIEGEEVGVLRPCGSATVDEMRSTSGTDARWSYIRLRTSRLLYWLCEPRASLP